MRVHVDVVFLSLFCVGITVSSCGLHILKQACGVDHFLFPSFIILFHFSSSYLSLPPFPQLLMSETNIARHRAISCENKDVWILPPPIPEPIPASSAARVPDVGAFPDMAALAAALPAPRTPSLNIKRCGAIVLLDCLLRFKCFMCILFQACAETGRRTNPTIAKFTVWFQIVLRMLA